MWISKSLTLKNIVKLYLKTDKLFRFLLQGLPISRKKPTGKACEARALYALKILTPRFSDFEKKTDCFAGVYTYLHRLLQQTQKRKQCNS